MAGHSKWANIRHRKGAQDQKRGKIFTKIIKEITISARLAGGDSNANPRLRKAISNAKSNNMPNDNVDRAVKRGTGGGDGAGDILEETTYEGYGPGGVAIMLHALTDNRNRTGPEIRSAFSKLGGSLGEMGCVSWNFESRGVVTAEISPDQGEDIAMLAIDAGADDFSLESSYLEIYASPENFDSLRGALEGIGVKVTSAEMSMVPKNTVTLDSKTAHQTLRLLDQLEDLDDVQKVYTNADFPSEVFLEYESR